MEVNPYQSVSSAVNSSTHSQKNSGNGKDVLIKGDASQCRTELLHIYMNIQWRAVVEVANLGSVSRNAIAYQCSVSNDTVGLESIGLCW